MTTGQSPNTEERDGVVGNVQERTRQAVETAQGKTREAVETAQGRARRAEEQGRYKTASGLERFARSLQTRAGRTSQFVQSAGERAAKGLGNTANYVRQRNTRQMLSDMDQTRPGRVAKTSAKVGAALGVGWLIVAGTSRFIRRRRDRES